MKELPGVSPEVLGALEAVGVKKLTDLLCFPAEELAARACIPLPDVLDIFDKVYATCAAQRMLATDLIITQPFQRLETGSSEIDKLVVDAGLHPGCVVEVSGRSGCGKSQLAMNTAANMATNDGRVIMVDSGGNISGQRLAEIVHHKSDRSIKISDCLRKITVRRCFHCGDFVEYLQDLRGRLVESRYAVDPSVQGCLGKIDLVIVDSIASLCQPLFGQKPKSGLAAVSQISRILLEIARQASCWVLVVNNHVETDDRLWKPSLGRLWSYTPSLYISLRDVSGGDVVTDEIEATVNGSCCPSTVIFLQLGAGGITGHLDRLAD